MFAINGPSGPTSRNERRVVTESERKQREAIKKHESQKRSESFFNVRKTAKAAAPAAEQAATTTKKTGDTDEKLENRESQIFKGCRVVFNGRTGKVSSSAVSATRVTHMVGSNLSGSKADKVIKVAPKCALYSPRQLLQHRSLDFIHVQKAGKIKVVSPGPDNSMSAQRTHLSLSHSTLALSSDWILQSVKHQKRQSEFAFLLYKDTHQQRLC